MNSVTLPQSQIDLHNKAIDYKTEEYKKRVIEKYGNKFDLSRVKIVNSRSMFVVKCPDHGWFDTNVSNLLNGIYGCPKCANKLKNVNQRNGVERFIEKAKSVHGDKYDYSKSVYEGNSKPIDIKCKVHGLLYR